MDEVTMNHIIGFFGGFSEVDLGWQMKLNEEMVEL